MKYTPTSGARGLLLAFIICFPVHIFSSPTVPNIDSPFIAPPAPNIDTPVIAVAPAAWFSPIHYVQYTNLLRQAGYQTISRRLPSCDSSNPEAQSVAADAIFIRSNLLLPSINAGRKVVLVVHSYSGGPGAVAAKGLSISERRAAGLPGGIIGLIFISAFIAEEGQSLLSSGGGQYAPWVIQYNDGQLGVQDGKDVFFHDVPEPLSSLSVTELRNQSRYSAETPCGAPAWSDAVYNGQRAFVMCTLDRAIPPAAQQALIDQSKVQWDIVKFQTGHTPFLSEPKALRDWTVNEISKFDAADRAGVVATS